MQVDPAGDGLSEGDVSHATPVQSSTSTWSTESSADLYKILEWGHPYFSINSSGNVSALLHSDIPGDDDKNIDLLKVVKKASEPKSMGGLGLQLPIIIRFPEILKHRLKCLQLAFDTVIRDLGNLTTYKGVYPVKCNQDAFIANEIVNFGAPFGFGLEAGSKPELLLAMSCLCQGSPDALLVCNGFKDSEYIKLALIARSLQFDAIIVLELEEEIELVIKLSEKFKIRPVIGIRAKLQAKHNGHFGSTSGKDGKFGLTGDQIDRIVDKLKNAKMIDCLQVLHFHIGSQIPSTNLVTDAVLEGAKIYHHLLDLGAECMRIIDVGGGLGVDYGGSESPTGSDSSINYTLEEYAYAVVSAVLVVCDENNFKPPIICSESGRAIVSHHSVLVFEVFSAANEFINSPTKKPLPESTPSYTPARTYHINLSIFTSIPDYWGIEQRFPILPIHRLEQKPTVGGILSDLTCDSDGLITKFIGGDTLLLHDNVDSKTENGKYYLGMFLGGAYQEALGGHHNLFGGPNIVGVEPGAGPNDFTLTLRKSGSSSRDVLRVMQHNPDAMLQTLVSRAENLVQLSPALINSLRSSFGNMPYLIMLEDEMNADEIV